MYQDSMKIILYLESRICFKLCYLSHISVIIGDWNPGDFSYSHIPFDPPFCILLKPLGCLCWRDGLLFLVQKPQVLQDI